QPRAAPLGATAVRQPRRNPPRPPRRGDHPARRHRDRAPTVAGAELRPHALHDRVRHDAAPPRHGRRFLAPAAAAVRARGARAVRASAVSTDDRTPRGAHLRADAMTEVLAFAAYLALPLIGLGILL